METSPLLALHRTTTKPLKKTEGIPELMLLFSFWLLPILLPSPLHNISTTTTPRS